MKVLTTRWSASIDCQNQVVTHKLQTTTQVSYSRFLKAYNPFGKTQNRMVNEQDTHTWISFKFRELLFPTFVYCSSIFCSTAVVSYVFHRNFALEIGARVPKTNPLTHALRLTVVFTTPHHIQRHDTARHGTARYGTTRHSRHDTVWQVAALYITDNAD